MLLVTALAFAVAWWLGLYLIARDPRKPVLRRTGLGLVAYAAALACGQIPGAAAFQAFLAYLPALAWTGALIGLLRDDRYDVIWRRGVVPLTLVAIVPAVFFGLPVPVTLILLVPLAVAFVAIMRKYRDLGPMPVSGLVIVATLLFGLGLALPLVPALIHLIPAVTPGGPLFVVGIGLDLVLLAVAVGLSDAFEEGESLRADMLRSLLGAVVVTVLFGGQAALAMIAGSNPALIGLLFGVMAAAIAVQVLAGPLHNLLDRLVIPGLAAPRAELREAAEALPRRAPLDDADLVRLTRRALSNYGDLGKLVSSPLAELPVIDARLRAKGSTDGPLERAAELKALLLDGIRQLKPPGEAEFGTSDEWRHYNALFFPYVEGIRPYRQRGSKDGLSPIARQAFDWFAAGVPERTLHNWQNAAAKLVAEHIRTTPLDEVTDLRL